MLHPVWSINSFIFLDDISAGVSINSASCSLKSRWRLDTRRRQEQLWLERLILSLQLWLPVQIQFSFIHHCWQMRNNGLRAVLGRSVTDNVTLIKEWKKWSFAEEISFCKRGEKQYVESCFCSCHLRFVIFQPLSLLRHDCQDRALKSLKWDHHLVRFVQTSERWFRHSGLIASATVHFWHSDGWKWPLKPPHSVSLRPLTLNLANILLFTCFFSQNLTVIPPLFFSFRFWCYIKLWNYWETTVVFLILALCNFSVSYKFKIIACFKNSWRLFLAILLILAWENFSSGKTWIVNPLPYFHFTPKIVFSAIVSVACVQVNLLKRQQNMMSNVVFEHLQPLHKITSNTEAVKKYQIPKTERDLKAELKKIYLFIDIYRNHKSGLKIIL